jgi:prephenate dehydratase
MRVAIQGEFGSFSHEAAVKMLPEATIVPCALSRDVFRMVQSEEAAAVIPIENSLAGSVVEHFDLLFQSDTQIEQEYLLRIRHNLIARPKSRLAEIRTVSSHPVALAQCRRFFESNPQMVATPAYDTAGSVKRMMEGEDPSAAAVASRQAAEFYGAAILADSIEDNPANFTRFLLIRKRDHAQVPSNSNKVSVAFIVPNQPGSLVSALQAFADFDTNLNKIESRPVHGQPWEYVFYADFQINSSRRADEVLEHLRRRCVLVKELGRYVAGEKVIV